MSSRVIDLTRKGVSDAVYVQVGEVVDIILYSYKEKAVVCLPNVSVVTDKERVPCNSCILQGYMRCHTVLCAQEERNDNVGVSFQYSEGENIIEDDRSKDRPR